MTVPESWTFYAAVALFMVCYGLACVWIGDRFVAAIEKQRHER